MVSQCVPLTTAMKKDLFKTNLQDLNTYLFNLPKCPNGKICTPKYLPYFLLLSGHDVKSIKQQEKNSIKNN